MYTHSLQSTHFLSCNGLGHNKHINELREVEESRGQSKENFWVLQSSYNELDGY